MPIVLPTVARAPSKRWVDQKFLTIGAGKIGKSDFWSQGERTLFLECEAGLNHLSCMSVPCRSWDDLTEVLGELYKANQAGKFQYDTLVVDTVDRFIDMANEYVIERAKDKFSSNVADKIETVGDIPNGAGWYNATNLVRITLEKMKMFPVALVLIGHVKTEKLKEGTREYKHDTTNIGGQMGSGLLHWADHTLHWRTRMRGEAIERCIRTKPSEEMEAGSRGNIVPDGFRIGESMKQSYMQFRSLFE